MVAGVFSADFFSKNYGVTSYGKVVLFDFDDIQLLRLINIRKIRPIVVKTMPIEAINRGSVLSESLPAAGDNKACTTGMATRMKPAV